MRKVKLTKTTKISGVEHKRGAVLTLREMAAKAVVSRGDAVYLDQVKPAKKEAPKVEIKQKKSFRERATAALKSAGVSVDGRWGDNRLKQLLADNGLEV